MTIHYAREIEKLKKKILSMSTVVEEVVYNAIGSIEKRQESLAQKTIDHEKEIDQMEVDIQEEGLKILALYHPVANDLRYVISILKINNDLERIGDLADNIAQRSINLLNMPEIPIPFNFSGMAEKTIWMLKQSVNAFINLDIEAAKSVCEKDDEVDAINREMYELVQDGMKKHPEEVNQLIHLLCISRHLERMADHVVNIAEDVIYMIEGKIIRHQHPENEKETDLF